MWKQTMHAALLAIAAAAALAAGPAAQGAVPAPDSVIGWEMCADYRLATYEQVAEYFRRLDAATDRLRLEEIGRTAEGRPQILAVISSEDNLRRLDRYKSIARQLALNRDEQGRPLTDAHARELAREGRAVVWIDYGLHATEVAPPQAAPWVAWRAVTEESEEMRAIRDAVIFLLVPNMNPDGGTMVAEWYARHQGTPWELSLPALYHKYVGHDNNRDWFMFTQPETRNVARQLYEEFFPQIVYNQHQTAPFPARIFVPPFEDPLNPHIPPLVVRGINLVGEAITRRLEREGKVGAISRVGFDAWWNGGMRTAPYFHNMVGILTETAHNSPVPVDNDPARFPARFANGESTTEPSVFYPSPYRGGRWTLRMSCEYIVSASLAVLDIGARRRQEWLFDVWQMARDHMAAGAEETYIVPADQWDPGAAVRMINTLRLGGVEVERATAPFTAGGTTYAAGSFVIRGAQPFLPYIRDLLQPQVYPDRRLYPDGPPEPPYDITGWTLPLQMGVRVDKVAERVTVPAERVERAAPPAGRVSGTAAAAYALDPRTNEAYIAVNRLLARGDTVFRAAAPIAAEGAEWPAGAFLVPAGRGVQARLEELAAELGLRIVALGAWPAGERVQLRPPRVGLYSAWGGNMDEGWTRWLFEQYEFPYTTVRDQDIRAGNLRARFDVIVLPDATYTSMIQGQAPGSMPPEMVGGMTARGVQHLHAFVAEGGTLVTLDTAAELPLAAFGLPVTNAVAPLRPAEFFIPGTLLRLEVDTTHPVAWGMPREVAAFFAGSPAFEVGYPGRGARRPPDGVTVAARYAERDVLLSGWLLGERHVVGRAAVVTAAVERGRVVLLGFRVQHRAQPHATFKLLFNAVYWGASGSPAGTAPTAGRAR